MPTLKFECELNAALERVWAFHSTVETLFKLTPPEKKAKLLGEPEPMRAGAIYRIQVRMLGVIPITMHCLIRDYTPPDGFEDIQLPGKGPFKRWEHRHQFTALSPNCTRVTDSISYDVPLGPLGMIADRLFVRRDLEKMFAYRHAVTRREMEADE